MHYGFFNIKSNAVAESFFKTLKYECPNRYNFKSYLQAYKIIEEYINWYNTVRMHSTLDYKSPAEFELKLKIINNQKVAKKIVPNLIGSPLFAIIMGSKTEDIHKKFFL